VAIDFDGTCVVHKFPAMGRDIGAEWVLKRLAREGARLILFTVRSGEYLDAAVAWFKEKDIPLYAVNRCPRQSDWSASPKCYAQLYIDDAALGCPLKEGWPGERPHVDWEAVTRILWPDDDL